MFSWDSKSPQWYLEEYHGRNSGSLLQPEQPFFYIFNSQRSISLGLKSTAGAAIHIVLRHFMQGTWVSEDAGVHPRSPGGNTPRIPREDCIYNVRYTDGEVWTHARITCNDAHGEDFKRHRRLCSKNESSLCLCCSVSHLPLLGATSVIHFLSFSDNLCAYNICTGDIFNQFLVNGYLVYFPSFASINHGTVIILTYTWHFIHMACAFHILIDSAKLHSIGYQFTLLSLALYILANARYDQMY